MNPDELLEDINLADSSGAVEDMEDAGEEEEETESDTELSFESNEEL